VRKTPVSFLGFFACLAFLYYHKAFLSGLMPAHLDAHAYTYPLKGLVRELYLGGMLPLWNIYQFSGFPLLAVIQTAVLYPFSVIPGLLLPELTGYNVDITLHICLAGFFTYLYARRLGLGHFASFSAGVLFAFMGYLVRYTPQLSVVRSAAWIPFILYCFEGIRSRLSIRSCFPGAVGVAMQLYAGHPQVCFYTYLLLLLYVLSYAFSLGAGSRARFSVLCAGAVGLGMVLAAPQLYATWELSAQSVRESLEYVDFASFSYAPGNLPALVFPFLFGGRPLGYIGQLPLLLAVVGLVMGLRGDVHVRFWGLAAVLSLVLALGDNIPPLHRLMYHVPVYNSFRGSERHVIEFSLALSLLSAFGISFVSRGGERARKALKLVLVCLSSVLAIHILVAAPGGLRALIAPETFVPVFFASVFLLLLVLVYRGSRFGLVKYVVAVAIAIEVLAFGTVKWVSVEKVENYRAGLFQRLAGVEERVAFLDEPGTSLLAIRRKIQLVGGYDPLIPGNYDTLLDMGGIGVRPKFWPQLVENNRILSMLNVRYVVLPGGMDIPERLNPLYRKLEEDTEYVLYENLSHLPRAYSVAELVTVDGIHAVKTELALKRLDPAKQAAVTSRDFAEIGSGEFARGEVSVLDYGHQHAVLRTEFPDRGFVVLADQYYPGWKAYVDGKEVKIYRTNGVLRGVVVPPGEHELAFVYRPYGIYVLMILSGTVLAGAGTAFFLTRRSGMASPGEGFYAPGSGSCG
jgi:hypothetical protein